MDWRAITIAWPRGKTKKAPLFRKDNLACWSHQPASSFQTKGRRFKSCHSDQLSVWSAPLSRQIFPFEFGATLPRLGSWARTPSPSNDFKDL